MRRAGPLLVSLALALSVGVMVAACGGNDGTQAFEEDVVSARDRTDSALAQITEPRSVDDLIVRMRIARDEIATASGEVAAAEAPESLADEKRQLAGALSRLATEVGGAADAFEELGPGAEAVRTLDFQTWNGVQKALEDLRAEGIEVEPLGRHGGEPGGTDTGAPDG
jgi:hypothetical protein